jgi:hypothetical protein
VNEIVHTQNTVVARTQNQAQISCLDCDFRTAYIGMTRLSAMSAAISTKIFDYFMCTSSSSSDRCLWYAISGILDSSSRCAKIKESLLAECFSRGCAVGVSLRENGMSETAKMIQHHRRGQIRQTITDIRTYRQISIVSDSFYLARIAIRPPVIGWRTMADKCPCQRITTPQARL